MDKVQRIIETLLEEKSVKFKNGLYHYTQVTFAYNSNKIEGTRLTEEQTAEMYETNSVTTLGSEVIQADDLIETKNHFKLFDFMLDHYADPITKDMMKEMHGILKRGTTQSEISMYNVGGFKLKPNIIGSVNFVETAAPEDVDKKLNHLLEVYNKLTDITFEDVVGFHYYFERIHPFSDGNGRVGRMILFKECLKNQIIPFVILDQHKQFYIRGLSEYKSEKGYLRDTCLNEQDIYTDVCEKLGVFNSHQLDVEKRKVHIL